MALPEIHAVASTPVGSISAIAPTRPVTAPGDLLLGWFESGGATTETEANTELTLAGWTIYHTEKKGNTRLTVAYKRATGASDRNTTNDTGDHQLGRLISVKAGTFNEEEPIHKGSITTQAKTKSVKCPSITTALNDCLIFFACSGNLPDTAGEGSGAGAEQFSGHTAASLGSVTERIDSTTAAGDGGALMVASGTLATAGSTGEPTATAVTEAERVCSTIAIAPYSDPGSPKPISASKTEATGTSQELTRPSGEAGDIILVSVWATKNKPVSVAGGTAIGTPKFLGSAFLMSTFWVPWSNGEKVKVTWEGSESQTTVVAMAVYRNCDLTTPVDVQSGWEEKATSVEPVAPAITTTGPNRRVIALTSNANGNEPDDLPAGMSMRINYVPAIADAHQAAAGSTGTKTFHLTISRVTGVQTIALQLTGTAFSKTLADSQSTSDSVAKAPAKVLADSETVAAAISKLANKVFADSQSTSDSVSALKLISKLLSDSVALTDALVKKASKALSDAQTVSDAVAKLPKKALSDSTTFSDALTKVSKKLLVDSIKLKDLIKIPALAGTFLRYLGKWVKVK